MNQFPIRVLSELTGVAPTTLRAWERRYGLLKPNRTSKGHRLYQASDLKAVRDVLGLLESNYPISKAVKIVRGELETDPAPVSNESSPWPVFRKRMLRAVERFDEVQLDAVYNEALSVYPMDMVSQNLLAPMLNELGDRWPKCDSGIAQEHFYSAYLRNKVGARIHHATSHGAGPRLLLACLPGEQHELGALMFGLALMARGYRLLYLGADLPLDQIPPVLQQSSCAGVILSGSSKRLDDSICPAMSSLSDGLSVSVFLGGRVSESDPDKFRTLGLIPLGSELAQALEHLDSCIPQQRHHG